MDVLATQYLVLRRDATGREVRDADVRAHSRVVTSLSGEFTDAGRN